MTAIEKALGSLAFTHDVSEARKELGDLRAENASLREQLRLANDKMQEQVRQARCEVADNALQFLPHDQDKYLQDVRDANAPKD